MKIISSNFIIYKKILSFFSGYTAYFLHVQVLIIKYTYSCYGKYIKNVHLFICRCLGRYYVKSLMKTLILVPVWNECIINIIYKWSSNGVMNRTRGLKRLLILTSYKCAVMWLYLNVFIQTTNYQHLNLHN